MMTDLIKPRVFMSYAWTSESYKDRVIELAHKLCSDGVDVVADFWDLNPGDDLYQFMERSVVSEEVSHVLLICNKVYAEKANDRVGGVGAEAAIISPAVYSKSNTSKYVPVIFEKDSDGRPLKPAYLQSSIHIDLSDGLGYSKNYELLIRHLFGRPESAKPKLGEPPAFLFSKDISYYPELNDSLRELKNAYYAGNSKMERFQRYQIEEHFLKIMPEFRMSTSDYAQDAREDAFLQSLEKMLPLRNAFLDYVELECKTNEVLNPEPLYKVIKEMSRCGCYKALDDPTGYQKMSFDNYRFLCWETFLLTAALLLKYEQFRALNVLLEKEYFNTEGDMANFLVLRAYQLDTLDIVRKNRLMKEDPRSNNYLSHTANYFINTREKHCVTMDEIIDTDLTLFYLSIARLKTRWYWFPMTYVYRNSWMKKIEYVKQLKDQTYFARAKQLWGFESLQSLTEYMAGQSESLRTYGYPNSFNRPQSFGWHVE